MTFLAEYLAGNAEPEDIHDQIDRWHTGPDDGLPLHAYLGMSWGQYAAWVERGALPARQL